MDIDLDCKSSFDPLDIFPQGVRASMVKNGELGKHPVGVYFQQIPTDPITGLSAIPYEQAEEVGYFKIDFLHLSVLDHFESKEEIRVLANTPPEWSLLKSKTVVSKLFQIANHFDVVDAIKPQSVQELADVIAIIRPGKRILLKEYLQNRESTREKLYQKTDKYSFKKSHSISYAVTIVLQLHLIAAGIL